MDERIKYGENPNEMWDLYDRERKVTERKHRRGDPLLPGDYHLVVHVCIFNEKNQMLIQQRQPFKKGWPNMWDLTVGGSATAGDTSWQAAEREALEELGLTLDLSLVRPHFTINFMNGYDDYYLITKEIEVKDLILQDTEVKAVKWVTKEEIMKMVVTGEMIPYYFLEDLFEAKNNYGSRFANKKPPIVKEMQEEHIISWMNLAEIAQGTFPELATKEGLEKHQEWLRVSIEKGQAICAVVDHIVVGCLIYDKDTREIQYLVVHPDFRGRKIVNQLKEKMNASGDAQASMI